MVCFFFLCLLSVSSCVWCRNLVTARLGTNPDSLLPVEQSRVVAVNLRESSQDGFHATHVREVRLPQLPTLLGQEQDSTLLKWKFALPFKRWSIHFVPLCTFFDPPVTRRSGPTTASCNT